MATGEMFPDALTSSAAAGGDRIVSAAPVAYLAGGTDYPDALSGAALAARDSAPLFTVPGNCVPAAILTGLRDMGTTSLVLLGGPASLTENVENLVECTTDLSRSGALLGFNQPFESFVPITSSFGMRVHPITGTVTMHNGTDYAKTGILGMPIRSLAVALVGTTGASTGPHLHLEIRINGTHVDPYLFLLGTKYATPVQ
ncbi:hypothetical protein ABIB15_000780 [Marisediminicola sp. UYEF4]|uniref:cell wall-binding repeat-containing protein n=1 Tax=Marisediminicola sp. UYEF4 TaxID=1756384 RepID=UPI00339A78C2